MTNVSKRPLGQKAREQLSSQFIELFSTANKKQHLDLFISLFSDAERTMFIKRLAIVLLLAEGFSTYKIAKSLIVSDSTVREIRAQYTTGRYDPMISIIRTKQFDRKKFWKTLELLLRAGMPPRGRGRWKMFYNLTET
jgi:Trp operon repressor